MTAGQLRAKLSAGDVAPVYLLESDDPPSRQELTQAFAALIEEGLEAFNVTAFFGRDGATAADRESMLADIVSTARTLPMMAARRVVIVHDAEALLAPKRSKDAEPSDEPSRRKAKAPASAADDFEAYLARPEPLTVLVLDSGGLDRNRRVTKVVLQHAIVVDGGTLDTPADAARWIAARLDAEEMTMDAAAVAALLEATGLRLPRLRAELEKLVLYAAGESRITAAHVKDVVMPSEEPGVEFALGKAIWASDAAAAVREVDLLVEAGAAPPMILGQARAAALHLRPEARLVRALRLLLESDLALKSSRGEPRYVLERLVVELCAGPRSQAGWGRR